MSHYSSIEKIFENFDLHIQQNKYSNHEFIKILETLDVNKQHLKKWAIQKYHQVYRQNCLFSAIHSISIDYEDIRQYQMSQLIAEETGITDGSDSHYALMKRFALSIGANEDEIYSDKPGTPIIDFFNFQYAHCKADPIYGMLSIYLVESQTAESVEKMCRALRKQFSLSDYELEWFIIHGEVEDSHAAQAKQLIIKHALDVEEFSNRGWAIIKDGVFAWNNLQNYYANLLKGNY